jgi:hypothetical protein
MLHEVQLFTILSSLLRPMSSVNIAAFAQHFPKKIEQIPVSR